MANLSFAFLNFQAFFFFFNSQLIEFADTELVDTDSHLCKEFSKDTTKNG